MNVRIRAGESAALGIFSELISKFFFGTLWNSMAPSTATSATGSRATASHNPTASPSETSFRPRLVKHIAVQQVAHQLTVRVPVQA